MTMQMPDGIHPTYAGFDQLGAYVYRLMQREGMRRLRTRRQMGKAAAEPQKLGSPLRVVRFDGR